MVYLFGASGHAKVIIEALEQQGIEIGGLKDDNYEIRSLLGYPVSVDFPEVFKSDDYVIISIGNNNIRKEIVLNNTFHYFTAIHPKAKLSTRAKIGEGSVIMVGATINADVHVGKHAIINTNASIDHDCIIEDYVHISPQVGLAGDVHVGEGTHIGIGACVIPGIKIGKWCTVGAGAVIIQDIPDGCTVVGNPGRVIKNAES